MNPIGQTEVALGGNRVSGCKQTKCDSDAFFVKNLTKKKKSPVPSLLAEVAKIKTKKEKTHSSSCCLIYTLNSPYVPNNDNHYVLMHKVVGGRCHDNEPSVPECERSLRTSAGRACFTPFFCLFSFGFDGTRMENDPL